MISWARRCRGKGAQSLTRGLLRPKKCFGDAEFGTLAALPFYPAGRLISTVEGLPGENPPPQTAVHPKHDPRVAAIAARGREDRSAVRDLLAIGQPVGALSVRLGDWPS